MYRFLFIWQVHSSKRIFGQSKTISNILRLAVMMLPKRRSGILRGNNKKSILSAKLPYNLFEDNCSNLMTTNLKS